MTDRTTGRTLSVVVFGARGAIRDVKDVLTRSERVSKGLGVEVQLLDATKVCGKEHLEVAAMRAVRAFDEGRNTANSLPVEVLLYASGKRQITEALDLMGIHEGEMEVAIVVLGPAGSSVPDDMAARLGFDADDDVLRCSDRVLSAFGIDHERLRDKVPPEKMRDLVLEKVAMLDVEK